MPATKKKAREAIMPRLAEMTPAECHAAAAKHDISIQTIYYWRKLMGLPSLDRSKRLTTAVDSPIMVQLRPDPIFGARMCLNGCGRAFIPEPLLAGGGTGGQSPYHTVLFCSAACDAEYVYKRI